MLTGMAFGYPIGASSPAEAALQRAIVGLGMLVNDAGLALKVDGVVGPGTTAAANRALRLYVTGAPAALRSGKLSVAQVKQQANALTSYIAQEITKRQKAPAKPAPVAAKAPAPAAKAPAAKTAAAQTLQRAVATLGAQRNDSTLKITADGIVGPKTVAAVNRAFTRFVTTAPANWRTGKLSTADVQNNAAILATYVEREVAAFKAAPAVAKAPAVSKAVGIALQTALKNLGTLTKDAVLKIAVDGAIGPRTAAAVKSAMTRWVRNAPAQFKNLNVAGVVANAAALTQLVNAEVTARKGAPASASAPAASLPAAKTPPNLTIARMQRATNDMAALVNDPALRIATDGIVGPKTTAAVNKALKYAKNVPSTLKPPLTQSAVSGKAAGIAAQLESEVAARRAKGAPPSAEDQAIAQETPDMPESAQLPQPSTLPEQQQIPQAVSQDQVPGAQAPQQQTPAATPVVPSSAMPDEMPPTRALAPIPAESLTPAESAEVAPSPGEKKFPWLWVGIGGGVLFVGGLAIYLMSRKREPHRHLAPA